MTTGIRLSFNPAWHKYLPLLVAIDRGHFEDAGVDVELHPFTGSAHTQLPLLDQRELDMTIVASAVPLLHHLGQGGDVRLIACINQTRRSHLDSCRLVVRQDLWDSGSVREPRDMQGMVVDGAGEGSPIDFLLRQALFSGGLRLADVRYQCVGRTADLWPGLLLKRSVDVQSMIEPIATQVEADGLGTRWLSYSDVTPWYQETYLAADRRLISSDPEMVVAFLSGLLNGIKEVAAAEGTWTPALLTTAAKWTKHTEGFIQRIGGLPYAPLDGRISIDSLNAVQEFWISQGLIVKPLPADLMVNMIPLERAASAVG